MVSRAGLEPALPSTSSWCVCQFHHRDLSSMRPVLDRFLSVQKANRMSILMERMAGVEPAYNRFAVCPITVLVHAQLPC